MANYKTAISFGLVHIPVLLNPIIKDNNTSFNYLHKKCGNRVQYVKFCPKCKKEVKQSDLVKGYEYQKEEYVIFENDDFEKLKSDNDKIIDIISFVNLNEIDPIYYEKSYYLKTDGKNKAFGLFKQALNKSGKVAIAKTTIGNKSYYSVLRFGSENIILSTLYYEEEIRLNEEMVKEEYSKEELNMAIKLIDSLKGNFEPENYQDEYQDKIKDAIVKKIDGKEIKQVKSKKKTSITNLMEALEKSIKQKRTTQ